MDKEGLKTLVFIGVGTFIGGLLKSVMHSEQKISVPVFARIALFILIAVIIGVFVYRKIK